MKLSLALATYNGQAFLRDQLDSFLSQTRRPDELVVSDDRSADHTLEILSEFRAKAPFPVRVMQNEHRLGIKQNFERVIAHCDGDVIFLSDQDDVWAPEKLARHEAVYRAHPEVGLVFSNGDVVDHALSPLGYTLYEAFAIHKRRQRAMNTGRALNELAKCSRATGATLSFRANMRDVLLPFPEHWVHDEWIAILLSALARVHHLPESLIQYRRHQAQAIGARKLGESERNLRPEWMPDRLVHISKEVERLTEVHDRLSSFGSRPFRADWRAVIEGKLNYLRRRRSFSGSRLARLPAIVRTALAGDYQRYGQWPKLELAADLVERSKPSGEARQRGQLVQSAAHGLGTNLD
jgi:glycosyltransferase involved in cell wall biosynthesis